MFVGRGGEGRSNSERNEQNKTTPNEAEVEDLVAQGDKSRKGREQEKPDIWKHFKLLISERVARNAQGHATGQDIIEGRCTEKERERNEAADRLADCGPVSGCGFSRNH